MDDFKSLPPRENELSGSLPLGDEESVVERRRNMEFQRSEQEKNAQSEGMTRVIRHRTKIAIAMMWAVAVALWVILAALVAGGLIMLAQIVTPLNLIPPEQMENAQKIVIALVGVAMGFFLSALSKRMGEFMRWRE